MSMSKLRRIGAVLTVLGLSGALFTHTAGAEGDSSFTVVARADALAIEYVNTAAPVFGENPVVYGTPASTQSLVDSVGQSIAFASAPYPGEIMAGTPDNGNGIIAGYGGPPVFPSYPFYVQSSYPARPSADQDQTGQQLHARSDQYASAGHARSGLIPGDVIAATQAQASSRAAVDPGTGTMTATADSRLDAFKVTDKLQIGKSASHAGIVAEPGKPIVKESSFTVASLVVNGVEVGLTDQGFRLGDQSPPGADLAAVFAPLRQAGVNVEYLPATGTESSIESAGLKVTQVREIGGQTQRVSLILGRVSTRLEGTAAPTADAALAPFPADDQTTAPDTATAAAIAVTPPPTALESAAPPWDAASGLTDPLSTTGGFESPDPVAVSPVAGNAASPPTIALPASRPVRPIVPIAAGWGLQRSDIRGLYVPAGLAGALMLLTPRLLRALGLGAGLPRVGAPADHAVSVLRLPR